MTAVMVTGATTPVGIRLCRELIKHDAIQHVVAVGIEPPVRAAPWLRGDYERLTYAQVDLTRPRQVRQLMFGLVRLHSVDTIVHMALHRSATLRGRRVHRLNVESTRLLLELSERHPTVRRFIYRGYGEVYRVRADEPTVIVEDHPLSISGPTPQWIRDRVEADLCVCTQMGLSPLQLMVLRCAEVFAKDVGSQLYDYLQSRVCFRPLGYDPMLNLLSIPDLVQALWLAVGFDGSGIFNIPGADTLPLSEAVRRYGKIGIPVLGRALGPLYAMRTRVLGTDFRYDVNHWRFHFSASLDGSRARRLLGYEPKERVSFLE